MAENNELIVQTLRDNNVPLKRISQVQDIDSVSDKNSAKQEGYLLVARNNDGIKTNYKYALTRLFEDIIIKLKDENISQEIEDYIDTKINEVNDIINNIKASLRNVYDKSTVNDKLSNLKSYIDNIVIPDIDEKINQCISLINDTKESLENKNSLQDEQINELNENISSLINSLGNYATKYYVDNLVSNTTQTYNNSLSILTNLLYELIDDVYNKEEIDEKINDAKLKLNAITETVSNIANELTTNVDGIENSRLDILEKNIKDSVSKYYVDSSISNVTTTYNERFDEILSTIHSILENSVSKTDIEGLTSIVNILRNEITTNIDAITNSRIDKIEADIEEIKQHGGGGGDTPDPPQPIVQKKYYLYIVDENNLNNIIDKENHIILETSISNNLYVQTSVNSCPMTKGRMYNANNIIKNKFYTDSDYDYSHDNLYMIIPDIYEETEENVLYINGWNAIKTNTLSFKVVGKDSSLYIHETDNGNINYVCIQLTENNIGTGIQLNY